MMTHLATEGALREPYSPQKNVLYLHPKQMEVFRAPARFRVVVAGRRWGKALGLDTPIPTPCGWTTMGALKDGDEVFDETGKPCRVVYAHEVMHDRPCYEVEFSDGTKVVADGGHLWSTWTHSERKNSRRNPRGGHGPSVRTTEQIAATLTTGTREDNNHSIPCAGPVQYAVTEQPIDPYLLGAWLGDGTSKCAALTSGKMDLDHFVEIVRNEIGGGPVLSCDRRSGAWRIGLTTGRGCNSGVQKKLRELGVFDNKHIPNRYLHASVEQRLALLQGLMDTDGTCNAEAGNCEFCSTNEQLANDVLELTRSLGIKATMIVGDATINGIKCGSKWRVKFSTDLQVFRLARKIERIPTKRRLRIGHRFIVAVRPVTSVPVRCITVDSPNSLYLCSRAFIPTHNTELAKVSIIKYARVKRRLIWYVAPSYRMAKQILWPVLLESIPKRWIRRMNETLMTLTLVNGTRIELKGADNPDSLRGVGIHFLVMDEVQDIDPEAWTKVLRPTLASTGGHVLFIGTPKSYNFLYEIYMQGQNEENIALGRWMSWQFPTITSPFIPPDEIEAARRDMDEKSFAQEFMASFETMSGRVYYPFDRKTHVGKYPFNPTLPIWVGQDFNMDPMSSSIMQPQDNGDIWLVDEICLKGSTEDVCDELERRYWRYTKQITIFPDPAGNSRQHARGETDLDIFRERGFVRQKFHKKHPLVADRVNAVNRKLKTADGRVSMYLDEKCKESIGSLEQTIYKPGCRDVDKDAGVEHMADAIGYPIQFMHPVRKIHIIGKSI
jgi:hypothetical protein